MNEEDNQAVQRRITHYWKFTGQWNCLVNGAVNLNQPAIVPVDMPIFA